jgi:hypothetical protein
MVFLQAVVSILGSLLTFIVGAFSPNLANSVKTAFDNALLAMQSWIPSLTAFFDAALETVKKWVNEVLGWLAPLMNLKFSGTADFNSSKPSQPAGKGDKPGFASGGIITKPTDAWIAEGGESEAVIPLSKLPGLVGQMYGAMYATPQAVTAGGSGTTFNIYNPTIRDDSDITRLADEIARKLSKKSNNSRRMGT